MKMRGDPCGCIAKFLNRFPRTKVEDLNGLRYEDDLCSVECTDNTIKAYSYEVINGRKYRNGECIMSIW
jgi:hypothetical protein